LVEWEPRIEQSRKEIDGKPARVFGEIHEILEIGEEISEEGKIELDLGTRDPHVHGVGGGDPILEDYLGDSFEKVGEINLEEDPQTPTESGNCWPSNPKAPYLSPTHFSNPSTNPQVSSARCSRICKVEQLYKTRASGD